MIKKEKKSCTIVVVQHMNCIIIQEVDKMKKRTGSAIAQASVKRDVTNLIMRCFIFLLVVLIFFYPNNKFVLTGAFALGGVFHIKNGIYHRKVKKNIISIYLLCTGILMILGAMYVLFVTRIG